MALLTAMTLSHTAFRHQLATKSSVTRYATLLCSSYFIVEGSSQQCLVHGRTDWLPISQVMELYVKASPDGQHVGDCPFAHYVRCVLHFKNLDYKLVPCTRLNKPDWLLNDPQLQGKMPCLVDGAAQVKMIESADIVQYLECRYPDPSLSHPTREAVDQALSDHKSFFPALAKFLKSPSRDKDLEEALVVQVRLISDRLAQPGHAFLAGQTVSVADYALAPLLFHAFVAVAHFYPDLVPRLSGDEARVKAYFDRMMDDAAFKATLFPEEMVIQGWSAARSSH